MSLRAYGRIGCMAVWLMLCLPMWVIARPFRREGAIVRLFLGGVGWLLGLRVRCCGDRLRGRVIYVANHISWLDIPALAGRSAARFIAKSDIAGWPLIGALARMGGSVFVARAHRAGAADQAREVGAAIGARPLVLFAEGGTGNGVTLAPFRPSLLAAANAAGVPVQPVAIDYGARAPDIAWPDGAGFGAELRRMLNRPAPVPVTLRFLPALDGGALDRKALAARTHAAIEQALAR